MKHRNAEAERAIYEAVGGVLNHLYEYPAGDGRTAASFIECVIMELQRVKEVVEGDEGETNDA